MNTVESLRRQLLVRDWTFELFHRPLLPIDEQARYGREAVWQTQPRWDYLHYSDRGIVASRPTFPR